MSDAEKERPTHVRAICKEGDITAGKIYRVVNWSGKSPNIIDDAGETNYILDDNWEPAPSPTPLRTIPVRIAVAVTADGTVYTRWISPNGKDDLTLQQLGKWAGSPLTALRIVTANVPLLDEPEIAGTVEWRAPMRLQNPNTSMDSRMALRRRSK